MIIRVYRAFRENEEPEVHCIVGTAPVKKLKCSISDQLQKVGSVSFSAQAGSFVPMCGRMLVQPYNDNKYHICCEVPCRRGH